MLYIVTDSSALVIAVYMNLLYSSGVSAYLMRGSSMTATLGQDDPWAECTVIA